MSLRMRLVATLALTLGCKSGGVASVTDIDIAIPPSVHSVTISPAPASLMEGSSLQLTAHAKDSEGNALNGRSVRWSSSDQTIVSVDSAGLVTAMSAGSALVAAEIDGHSNTADRSAGGLSHHNRHQ